MLFVLIWTLTSVAYAQNITVRGSVIDSQGNPLIGVSVQLQGSTIGTITDSEGNYILSDVPPNGSLLVSHVGMNPQTIAVNGRHTIDVTLAEDNEVLEELVVVGYGTMRKSDVTGSVSTVKADGILKNSAFGALDGLKGKASGVNVFSNSGQPGGLNRVLIRGIGTFNSSSDPLYVVDGVVMEDFQFLNPNDIERVDVLKDASASAIYGARGANGVILVSTRRGLKGDGTVIGYSGYLSISTPASKMEVMNAKEFMETLGIANINHSKWWPEKPQVFFTPSDSRLFNTDGSPKYNTDWQDEATRTAISHNHQISIRQGGKNSSVGVFLNYTDQQGVMLNTYMKRLNAKMTYDASLTPWLSTGINLLVNHSWQNETNEYGGSQIPLRTMIEMPPILPVKLDGEWTNSFTPNDPFKFEAMANPVHALETTLRMRYRTQIFGNAAFTFHISPNLDLRTQLGIDSHLRKWKEFYPTDLINISAPNGRVYMNDAQVLYWQEESYLTYNNKFNKNRLNVVAGLSWQERTVTGSSAQTEGFVNNFYGFNNMGAGRIPGTPLSEYSRQAMNSYFMRTVYSFDERYMATITARFDGSSTFGKNNKFAFFPSFGLAWLISEEKFMKEISSIDML